MLKQQMSTKWNQIFIVFVSKQIPEPPNTSLHNTLYTLIDFQMFFERLYWKTAISTIWTKGKHQQHMQ